jgi:hypothetical protein
LWEKIPGVTDGDLEAWENMRTEEMAQSAEMAARSFGVEFAQPAEAAGAA